MTMPTYLTLRTYFGGSPTSQTSDHSMLNVAAGGRGLVRFAEAKPAKACLSTAKAY